MNGDLENFKERVRSAADIVEVISGYVPLKKKGQNFWGCCPFHGEKTPSFSVSPHKNMFYCFGCHEGGDVFKFIMKTENCGFMDAVKLLAGKYGIPVPEYQKTAAEIAREQQSNKIYEANELAARFFQACLKNYGQQAIAYLSGRGITKEIIEQFSMGYALQNFSALQQALSRHKVEAKTLMQAGLVAVSNGRAFDKFRNRVMIPIKDPRGRIVGFGGRVLDDSRPKYMNTGETEWFNKRRLLFGFDIALKSIRSSKQAVVVEGYMDAISLHAAGITNVVASMGTAFATEQARLLKRACEEVVFCYDSDEAGRRSSVRAVSVAKEAGLRVRIAGVPDGKDPDEFVRHHGKEAFLKVIENAVEGVSFQIFETISQHDTTNLAGKVTAVSNILPFLLECKNEIEASEHIRQLAQRLTIDEGLITEEYRKALRKGRKGSEPVVVAKPEEPLQGNGPVPQAEEMLLAAFIENPELLLLMQDRVVKVGFTNKECQDIFQGLQAQSESHSVDLQLLHEGLSPEASSVLAGAMARQLPEADLEQVADDCIRHMQRTALEREYEKHSQLAATYERSGDERFLQELMESQRVKNEIKKLY